MVVFLRVFLGLLGTIGGFSVFRVSVGTVKVFAASGLFVGV